MSAPDKWAELLQAAKEALYGMDGGHDDARCHIGITTREKCAQCRRVDGLRRAIIRAESES